MQERRQSVVRVCPSRITAVNITLWALNLWFKSLNQKKFEKNVRQYYLTQCGIGITLMLKIIFLEFL